MIEVLFCFSSFCLCCKVSSGFINLVKGHPLLLHCWVLREFFHQPGIKRISIESGKGAISRRLTRLKGRNLGKEERKLKK